MRRSCGIVLPWRSRAVAALRAEKLASARPVGLKAPALLLLPCHGGCKGTPYLRSQATSVTMNPMHTDS